MSELMELENEHKRTKAEGGQIHITKGTQLSRAVSVCVSFLLER